MMPEMDGYEFLRHYRRQEHHTPVILLGSSLDYDAKFVGIEFGASDYITKPLQAYVLVASVERLLYQK